jgi:hypothetical protein
MSRLLDLDTTSLTPLHWAAFALAITSGVIHLVLIVAWDIPPTSTFGILFLLTFGGYLGGVALVAINYRRRLLYLLGVPYTGSQIVMWYLANQPAGPADISAFEWIDKIAQLLLLVVLVMLYLEED